MRKKTVVPAFFISMFLVSAAAMADEEHSFCTPGAAKDPSGSSSDLVRQVVGAVCSMRGFASCCDRTSGQGKWALACVERAADYAKNTLNHGDYCGRFAWALGPVEDAHDPNLPIRKTAQYYPRDFSIVALSGNVTGLSDVPGPVAARGDVSARSFTLNSRSHKPVAVVADGTIDFANGSVFGDVYYGHTPKNPPKSVTYHNGSAPSSPTQPSPVKFDVAFDALQNMSAQLNAYDSTTESGSGWSTRYSTMKFTGANPELNVFSLNASDFNNIYTVDFSGVAAGSAVVINVKGSAVTLKNLGFTTQRGPDGMPLYGGVLPPNKMLWNFPEATSLTIQSVEFPGSMLAPLAKVTTNYSGINGTLVVGSLVNNSELHWYPYLPLGCTRGCLCLDANWSCSSDTRIEDDGTVNASAAEAGFLQIPGGPYQGLSTSGSVVPRNSPTHRVWYSYWPASSSPETKPLAIFFNGGPGFATSADLFSFSTGPYSLDPDMLGTGQDYVPNSEANWRDFANLLYIDAPATGFSYPSDSDSDRMDVGNDPERDAGVFLEVVTRFLLRHPALLHTPVILVGESYGGMRATLMLKHLIGYAQLDNKEASYQDPQLLADLQAYFLSAYNTNKPDAHSIYGQFGHQALIEPGIAGQHQADLNRPNNPIYSGKTTCDKDCIGKATCDRYDCDKSNPSWGTDQANKAASHLTHLDALRTAVGVDPTSIRWMYQAERTLAHGRGGCNSSTCPDANEMTAQFGMLDSTRDSYFVTNNGAVGTVYGKGTSNEADTWLSAGNRVGDAFVNNVFHVYSLITVAEYDGEIYSPTIPIALNKWFGVSAWYDASAPNVIGNGRNGLMTIYSSPDILLYVAMPHYMSGHSVPTHQANGQGQARQLALDVASWYQNTH